MHPTCVFFRNGYPPPGADLVSFDISAYVSTIAERQANQGECDGTVEWKTYEPPPGAALHLHFTVCEKPPAGAALHLHFTVCDEPPPGAAFHLHVTVCADFVCELVQWIWTVRLRIPYSILRFIVVSRKYALMFRGM